MPARADDLMAHSRGGEQSARRPDPVMRSQWLLEKGQRSGLAVCSGRGAGP